MRKSIIVLLFIVLFFSCKNSGTGWSETMRKAFIESCNTTATPLGDKAKSYCDCVQKKVEAKYPDITDINKIDASAVATIAAECIK